MKNQVVMTVDLDDMKPEPIPISTVRSVFVEADCIFCAGKGNHDHVTDDGSVIKCPVPCACKGSGRTLTKVTLDDFVLLLKEKLAKS